MFVVKGLVSGLDTIDSIHVTFEAALKRLVEYRVAHPHSCGTIQFVTVSTDADGAVHWAKRPTIEGYHIGWNGRICTVEEHEKRKASTQNLCDRLAKVEDARKTAKKR